MYVTVQEATVGSIRIIFMVAFGIMITNLNVLKKNEDVYANLYTR